MAATNALAGNPLHTDTKKHFSDSRTKNILQDIFLLSKQQQGRQWHFKAKYYVRTTLSLTRRNFLCLTSSYRRFYLRGGLNIFSENEGDIQYYTQNHYSRKIRTIYSGPNNEEADREFTEECTNVNIYANYMQVDHLLSPLVGSNAIFYNYTLDSIKGSIAYITFTPKRRRKTAQLVKGQAVYDTYRRQVTQMTFRAMYNAITFTQTIKMGTGSLERYWPEKINVSYRKFYFGNIMQGEIKFTQNITEITDNYILPKTPHRHDHDLSDQFRLLTDYTPAIADSLRMTQLRTIPLTAYEDSLFMKHPDKLARNVGWARASKKNRKKRQANMNSADTSNYHSFRQPSYNAYEDTSAIYLHEQPNEEESSHTPQYLKQISTIGEYIFGRYRYTTPDIKTQFRTAADVSYDNDDGIRYRQDITFLHIFPKHRQILIAPTANYAFKRKEILGRVYIDLLAHPKSNSKVIFEAGRQATDYKMENADTTARYLMHYIRLDLSRELFNGFTAAIGVGWHQRTPMHIDANTRKKAKIKSHYTAFALSLTATYTPCMRYYWLPNQTKQNLGSPWPTFIVNYERGIKGVLASSTDYERIELSIAREITLSPLVKLLWKAGGGMFMTRDDRSFIQYNLFNQGFNFYNWDDSRGGIFQILSDEHYNNSSHYLRGHIIVESPMILGRIFNTYIINKERFYANILVTEGLVPYMELGYGISTNWIDASYFVNYIKREGFQGKLRFSLHLFR